MYKKLLLLAVLAVGIAKAQQPYQMTPREAEKHAKEIERSREKGDAIWDYDTVFLAGMPYCLLYKVEKGFLVHDDYSVRALNGQELIYIKYATYPDYTQPRNPDGTVPQIGYYSYVFLDSRRTAETLTERPFKMITRYNLIANASYVDPNAEAAFIAQNPVRYSLIQPPATVVVINNPPPVAAPPVQPAPVNNYVPPAPPPQPVQPAPVNNYVPPTPPAPVQPAPVNNYVPPAQPAPVNNYVPPAPVNNYVPPVQPAPVNNYVPPTQSNVTVYSGQNVNYGIVQRDPNAEIYLNEGSIMQGGIMIGTVDYREDFDNGYKKRRLKIYLPNGTQVAEAFSEEDEGHSWKVITFRDNMRNYVHTGMEHDNMDVIWYLVRGQYL